MKKFLLSLAALTVCASLSAKTELTQVTFGIPEDGTVGSWSWNQASALNDAHWDVSAEGDSTWVEATFDYADASAYDYIAITFDEVSLGTYFFIQHTDWADSNRASVEINPGQCVAGIATKDLGEGAAAIQTFILQPKGAGILKNPKIYYLSTAEYEEMVAAENAREKYLAKVENVEVPEIGGWTQVGPWFGEESLDVLYKTVVVELTCTANISVKIQSWNDGVVHSFDIAASEEPVVIALPLSECGTPGIGQVALSNINVSGFMTDAVSGLPVSIMGPASAVVKRIYYTSNEVASTYQPAVSMPYPMITFDGSEVSSLYSCPTVEGFTLEAVDTDSKHVIDENNATFGLTLTAEENDTIATNAIKFTTRLKVGGKSGSKNKLTVNIPHDGVLTVAVRSGSSSAVDRKFTITQDGEELYSDIVMDAMAVSVENETGTKTTAYPLISVPVKAGKVDLTYAVGALNFYGFLLTDGYYVEEEPEEPEEPEDPQPEEPIVEGDEIVVWEGEVTSDAWSGQGILTDGSPELIAAGMKVGDVVRLYFTCEGELNLNVIGGHWEKDENEKLIILAHAYSNPNTLEYVDVKITQEVYDILTTMGYWGSGLMIQAGSTTTCTKICLIKNANSISAIEATPAIEAVFNIAGQRTNATTGLMIRGGKVIMVK